MHGPVAVSVISKAKPSAFALAQNSPNPFNAQTQISYALPEEGWVTLKVYNLTGQVMRTLVDGEQDAGYHRVHWDGRDEAGREMGSGIYFYELRTEQFSSTRRMLLLR